MPGRRQRRVCPFCGTRLVLGELPIVATNEYAINSREDDDHLPSGTRILGWLGREEEYPLVDHGPLYSERSGAAYSRASVHGLRELPPLTVKARPEDLPARFCTQCQHPLPADIDDRDVYTIAVVGTPQSGKTHFLASMLRDASMYGGLEEFGCEEFAPDEDTATRYDENYYQPLFEQHEVLQGTVEDDLVRFRPLTFRVSFAEQQPCLVMFHDVSGQTLINRGARSAAAGFVRRADAVIFLLDPTAVRRFRRDVDLMQPNQARLLSGCIDDLPPGRRPPFAITLSKSDLVSTALRHEFVFSTQPPADVDKWNAQLAVVGREVQDVLAREGLRDVLAAARRLEEPDRRTGDASDGPVVSFHAVAPLGAPADDAVLDRDPQPLRCLEPLVTVLYRIPGVVFGDGNQ